MNITTIARFGARFGVGLRSAVRRANIRKNVRINNALAAQTCAYGATDKPAQLTAIWHVNPQDGRVECRWSKEPDEIASYQALPVLERFGLILAANQQSRASDRVHG